MHRPFSQPAPYAFLFLLSIVLMGAASFASPLPTAIEVEQDVVYLDDIFKDAPNDIALMQAPAIGKKTLLKPRQLLHLAKQYNQDLIFPPGFKHLVITRKSQQLTHEQLIATMRSTLTLPKGNPEIIIDYLPKLHIPEGTPVSIERFHYNPQSHIFTAEVVSNSESNRHSHQKKRFYGKIVSTVEIPTLNRIIKAGEQIMDTDITLVRVPETQVQRHHLLDTEEIVGKSARRLLRPNQPIRTQDVKNPIAIKKGSIVPVEYMGENMRLILKAEALQDGTLGDTISFRGYDRKKVIHAKVTGLQQARVEG